MTIQDNSSKLQTPMSNNGLRLYLMENIAEFLCHYWENRLPKVDFASFFSKIAKVTLIQICRHVGTNNLLCASKKNEIICSIEKLAKPLFYSINQGELNQFSFLCAKSFIAALSVNNIKTIKRRFYQPTLKDNLETIIRKELIFGANPANALQVAAKSMLFESKKKQALREQSQWSLQKNDIKKIMNNLKGKNTSVFSKLIRKSLIFTKEFLEPKMGLALYQVFRPVGFGDKNNALLLVEVSSSIAAHEFSFRKPELIATIKKVPGFENVQKIRLIPVTRPC